MGVTVNGTTYPLDGVPVHRSLLDHVRDQGLTGAKEGCAEGECGACSVMVLRADPTDTQAPPRWTALNACLVPRGRVRRPGGRDRRGPRHPRRAAPGPARDGRPRRLPVRLLHARLRLQHGRRVLPARPRGGAFDEHALSGNLCRCNRLPAHPRRRPRARRRPRRRPARAAHHRAGPDRPTGRRHRRRRRFVRPAGLDEALRLLADEPDAVVVAGSTDWGVDVNLKGRRVPLLVGVDRLPELRTLHEAPDHLEIGAALTLSELERGMAGRVPLLDALWPQFASRLIRNGATLGGNLATGSPIGDSAPVLLALEADVVLVGPDGERVVPLDRFFTGYRTSVRRPGELLRAVRIPLPAAGIAAFHKIAKRRYDDISSVAVAHALDVRDGTVVRARIGLGGVAATPVRALATEAALEGRPWSLETVLAASEVLSQEGTPIDDQRASAAYRRAMLGTSLQRLWHDHDHDGQRAEVTA